MISPDKLTSSRSRSKNTGATWMKTQDQISLCAVRSTNSEDSCMMWLALNPTSFCLRINPDCIITMTPTVNWWFTSYLRKRLYRLACATQKFCQKSLSAYRSTAKFTALVAKRKKMRFARLLPTIFLLLTSKLMRQKVGLPWNMDVQVINWLTCIKDSNTERKTSSLPLVQSILTRRQRDVKFTKSRRTNGLKLQISTSPDTSIPSASLMAATSTLLAVVTHRMSSLSTRLSDWMATPTWRRRNGSLLSSWIVRTTGRLAIRWAASRLTIMRF